MISEDDKGGPRWYFGDIGMFCGDKALIKARADRFFVIHLKLGYLAKRKFLLKKKVCCIFGSFGALYIVL